MTEPVVVVEPNVDVIELDTETSLDVVVVEPTAETIVLETDVLIGQGPKGDSPSVSIYNEANVSVVDNVLTVNAAAASTFVVAMDQSISNVVVTDWAGAGKTQRIVFYFIQDAAGGHVIANTAWPSGTIWSFGQEPVLTSTPLRVDALVLEKIGNTIFGAMIGQNYF